MFSEKLTTLKIISLTLSLLGLYLIYSFSVAQNDLLFGIISFIAGLATAVWNILPKKISSKYGPFQLTFIDNVFGGVLGLLISLFLFEKWIIPTLSPEWGFNALLGSQYVLTGFLVIIGFRKLDAQIGSLIMLSEVLFAIILGFLIFSEVISLPTAIGGLLIIVAISLPELKEILRKKFR